MSLQLPGKLDFSGGVAQFRHRQTRLEELQLAFSEADLLLLAREALRASPVFPLAVQQTEGSVAIFAEWRSAAGRRIPLFMRGMWALSGEQEVSLSVFELQLFGQAERTAPEMCAQMLDAFLAALPAVLGRGRRVGATLVELSPLEALLGWTLVPLGWKLPDRTEVRFVQLQAEEGVWRLRAARGEERTFGANENGPYMQAYLSEARGRSLCEMVDLWVAEGERSKAISAYQALRQEAPEDLLPFVIDRLRLLDAVDPSECPESTLGSLSDRCCRARRLEAQGKTSEAGQAWLELAQWLLDRGEKRLAAFAHFAAGQAFGLGASKKAQEAFAQAGAGFEGWGSAFLASACCALERGDIERAQAAFSKLLAQSGVDLCADMKVLGERALKKGTYDLARQAYEAAKAVAPAQVEVICGLARAVEAQDAAGRALEVVRIFEEGMAAVEAEHGDAGGRAILSEAFGDFWQRAGEREKAIRAYQEALQFDSGRPSVFCALADCAFLAGEKSEGLRMVEAALLALSGRPQDKSRADLNLRVARLLCSVDAEKAVRFYQQALAGTCDQVEEALRALEQLHGRSAGDYARDLELAIHHATEAQSKASWLARLSQVMSERLNDDRRARSLLLEARVLNPKAYAEPLLALDRKLGEAEEAAALCLALADCSLDVERTAGFYCERGDLLLKQLGRPEEAAAAYTLALGVQPKHLGALEGLEAFYRDQNRRAELLEVLKRHGDLLEEDAAALCFAEAALLEAGMGEKEAARYDVEQALAAAGIWGKAADLAMAEERLEALYQECASKTAAAFLAALCEGAGLEETRSEAFSNVLGRSSGGLDEDSDFFAFADEPLGDEEGSSAGGAESLRKAAIQAGDSEDAAELWLLVAENERDEQGNMDAAEEAWQRALDLASPGSDPWQEALENLEDVYAVDEKWDHLLALYDLRRLGGESETSIELLKASIFKAAGRIEEAIASARSALSEGDRALDLLVTLLSESGRNGEAAEVLLSDLDELGKKDAGYRKWKVAGLLADTEPSRAAQFYREAASVVHESMLIEDWVNFAREAGLRADLGEAMKAQAGMVLGETGPAKAKRSRIYFEAAQLQEDLTEKRSLLDLSLQSWPENVDAMDLLEQVLQQLGDNEGLLRLWDLQAAAALPGKFRGRIFAKQARLQAEMGQREAARASAQRAAEDCAGTADAEKIAALMETLSIDL